MRKDIQKLLQKSPKELKTDEQKLREEIAKVSLEAKINATKDTNLLRKKRKKLAQLLTVYNYKREEELLARDIKKEK